MSVLFSPSKKRTGNIMRVQCSISMTASDIRCPICGQGVLIHNTARSRDLLQLQRRAVAEGLREHHLDGGHHTEHFTIVLAHAIPMPEAPAVTPQNLALAAFAS